MEKGRFITFEGVDGAGKTSRIDELEAFLRSQGIKVVRTREPGGTDLGEKIRTMLLSFDMDPATETLLFFALRAEHLVKVIKPAIECGVWVLSDRFTDATYAYQVGGKGVASADVLALEALVHPDFQPDKTVLFDVDPAIAAQRLTKARAADRFELENRAFFERVRKAYLDRAKADPERFLVLDSSQAPEAVAAQLLGEARKWL